MKVHLAKLFNCTIWRKQTTTILKIGFEIWYMYMRYANVPKHCLKRIETEGSHHDDGRKNKEVCKLIFSHCGLLCASFVKLSG